MRHFRRIASDIDTSSIRTYLDAHPYLWDHWMDPEKQDDIKAEHGAWPSLIGNRFLPFWDMLRAGAREALLLRRVAAPSAGRLHRFDNALGTTDCAPDIDSIAAWARDTVRTIVALVGACDVGCIDLINLRAGETVHPHVDTGGDWVCDRCRRAGSSECRYFKRYPSRFHCPIRSNSECIFEVGGEKVCMAPGELWWFNNRVSHSVTNAGSTDRIHLIFDARVAQQGAAHAA